MSDRIKGFIVTLSDDLKDEDAARLRDAIIQIRGVETCEPSVADFNDHMNRSRIRNEIAASIWNILYPDFPNKK